MQQTVKRRTKATRSCSTPASVPQLNSTAPDSCLSRIHAERQRGGGGPISILNGAVKGTIDVAARSATAVSNLAAVSADLREAMAIHDCVELLDLSVDELAWSLDEIGRLVVGNRSARGEANLLAWLSAALGNQDTCLEGFDGTDGRVRRFEEGQLEEVSQLVSNLLAMYRGENFGRNASTSQMLPTGRIPVHRHH